MAQEGGTRQPRHHGTGPTRELDPGLASVLCPGDPRLPPWEGGPWPGPCGSPQPQQPRAPHGRQVRAPGRGRR